MSADEAGGDRRAAVVATGAGVDPAIPANRANAAVLSDHPQYGVADTKLSRTPAAGRYRVKYEFAFLIAVK
jgi:methyl coenzyme M reductase alpha subunit